MLGLVLNSAALCLPYMKTLFTVFAIIVINLYSLASERSERAFEFDTNRIAFSGVFSSSYSWQLDASWHYMVNPYIGLGASIGTWEVVYPDGHPEGADWRVEYDEYGSQKPWNLFIRPSAVLKTPGVRIKKCEIGFFAQPGIMMNIPYASVSVLQGSAQTGYTRKTVSTTKGQWLAFDAKIGPSVNVGPCGFSIGYLISTHDIYGQFKCLKYDGVSFDRFYPKKTLLQGIYAMASYYF